MKTIALIVLLLALPIARSQVIVHDPILADIAVTHNAEELLKLVRMIEEMQATKDWIGNGKKILELAGIDAVFTNLRTESIGISRVELATTATSAAGATYEGDGLYVPVGETFVSRDGQTITRPDVFKPEAALFNAVKDHDAVYEDVMRRRAALRLGLEKTLSQLQGAATIAEVQKTAGVLLSQHAELEATDRELTFATQKAVLIDLQNRADKERQEKATRQEQAREFAEGLRHLGTVLSPPVFVPRAPAASSQKASTP